MKTPRNRQESKLATRERLIDAALELIVEEGSIGFSMNKVTKRAGIAQPSFYNHFDDLEGLFEAMFEVSKDRYFYPLRNAFVELMQTAQMDNIYDIFLRMYTLGLEMIREQGALYRMVLAERAQMHSRFGQHVRTFIEDIQQEWITISLDFGIMEDTPESRMKYRVGLDAMFAMLEGFAIHYIDGRYKTIEQPAALMSKFTFDYLYDDLEKFFARQ